MSRPLSRSFSYKLVTKTTRPTHKHKCSITEGKTGTFVTTPKISVFLLYYLQNGVELEWDSDHDYYTLTGLSHSTASFHFEAQTQHQMWMRLYAYRDPSRIPDDPFLAPDYALEPPREPIKRIPPITQEDIDALRKSYEINANEDPS